MDRVTRDDCNSYCHDYIRVSLDRTCFSSRSRVAIFHAPDDQQHFTDSAEAFDLFSFWNCFQFSLVINLTYFTKERKVRRWSETFWRRPDHTKCPDWSAPGQKILASTMKLTGLADCNRFSFFYPLTRFYEIFENNNLNCYVFVGRRFQCFPGNQKHQACLPWPAKRVG